MLYCREERAGRVLIISQLVMYDDGSALYGFDTGNVLFSGFNLCGI
jgi:hypothetical protein